MDKTDVNKTASDVIQAIITSKSVQQQGTQVFQAIGKTAGTTVCAAATAAVSGSGVAGVGAAVSSTLTAGGVAIGGALKGLVAAVGGPVGLAVLGVCAIVYVATSDSL